MRRDALAVYRALSEIASDRQKETFAATHAMIFHQSGVSVTQIKRALNFLKANHFISWTTPLLRGPCLYTLIDYHVNAIGQPELTLGQDGLTLGHGRFDGKTATSEESLEESQKNPENNLPPAPPPASEAKKPRPRNELSDALAIACGSDPLQMTSSAARTCAVKAAEIRKASPDVTPDEMKRRAQCYLSKYRDASLTPPALCAHWAEFGSNGFHLESQHRLTDTERKWADAQRNGGT